ncbi:MAG: hypothetical protein Q9226_001153 [Calogaya cf. arnoldii]
MGGQISSIGAGQGGSTTAVGVASPAGLWQNIIKRSRSRSDLQANGSSGSLANTWAKQNWPPMPTLAPPFGFFPKAEEEIGAGQAVPTTVNGVEQGTIEADIDLSEINNDCEDDDSYVPVWKQEITDERGRKRLHGAFTGGFSTGYFNTVGSKGNRNPSTFISSRESKKKDSQPVIQQKPEAFMDEEDITNTEEARKLQTAESFDGFSEDDEDVSGQGIDEKEVDRIVGELLGKYTTLFEETGHEGWRTTYVQETPGVVL